MRAWYRGWFWEGEKEEYGTGLFILEFWNKSKEFLKYSSSKDYLEIDNGKGNSVY